MRSLLMLHLCLGLCACKTEPTVISAAPVPQPSIDQQQTPEPERPVSPSVRVKQASAQLGQALQQRMQQALTEGGPEAALRACADEAQGLTALVQAQTGVRVGRTSLRLRNPANAGPDWVLLWLEANKEAQRDAVTSYEQIDETESGRVARIATPIFIGPQCLTCHGPSDARPPALAAVLAARYPSDEAHGYENGALRGAIWAETPVD